MLYVYVFKIFKNSINKVKKIAILKSGKLREEREDSG